MTIVKSDLAERQSNVKYDPILPRDMHGRVRVMAGEVEVKEASSSIILGYLPAGEGRVLGGQSSVAGDLTTAMSFGLGSYTPIKGGPVVVADPTLLQSSKTIAAADFDNSKGAGIRYSSAVEVPVIAKAASGLTIGDKFNFSILYVID